MSYVVGITGRSGSGKTTLVRSMLEYFGPEKISLHTMDNYYRPREEQLIDDHDYKNFDLPSSFYRERFIDDLHKLMKGEDAEIEEYVFNNESDASILYIKSAPIILVEGLFVFHYEEIRSCMDLKVVVDVPLEEAFRRRLFRDTKERNYTAEEVSYRYEHHVEPAYQEYIAPHVADVDVVVDNRVDMKDDMEKLMNVLSNIINSSKSNMSKG